METTHSADTMERPEEEQPSAAPPFTVKNDATLTDEFPMSFENVVPFNNATMETATQSQIRMVRPTARVLLMLAHLCGCLAMLLLTGRQVIALRRMVKVSRAIDPSAETLNLELQEQLGLRRRVRVLTSSVTDSPVAFGIWKPTVVLPANFETYSESDVRTVLAHEFAHLRKGDHWTTWLQVLLATVWWFHPVLWALNRRVRRVREECCDDLLIASGLTDRNSQESV